MRPKFHFTAPKGWINDPNGLVYSKGKYHIFYQHNPNDIKWGDIHWGHAVSDDMFTFTDYGDALYPDEYGLMYSGSAIVDENNVAGFGKNTVLAFYTAAKKDNYTQHIAYMKDGINLIKAGKIIDTIEGENRDPKVFYHPESNAYILVLFLTGFEFGIFRSKDCIHWELSQKMSFDGMRECPGLMRIGNDFILWSAPGKYVIGDFDGYKFTPKTGIQLAYARCATPYAAQDFSNTGDRVISVGWFKSGLETENWFSMLTFPHELSIVETPDGRFVAHNNVKELYDRLSAPENTTCVKENAPFVLSFDVDGKSDNVKITICGTEFEVKSTFHVPHKVEIAVDYGVIEATSCLGTYYLVKALNVEDVSGEIKIEGNYDKSSLKLQYIK